MRKASAGARPLPRRDDVIPWALAIFLAALSVRLLHLWQIRPAPFFQLLMGDAQSYHAWALEIAGGDWIGAEAFYQAPLYPYFLGSVYALLGPDPLVVRACQAVLGALACVWLALAGWRLFSRPVGIAAGLMLAGYAPAIFFDGLVQKSVLDAFLLCLALLLLSRLIPEPTRRWSWLALGVTFGCLVLSRENALVFAAAALIWLLWRLRHLSRERFVLAGCLVAGLAIVLLPVALRNLAVSGELHLTTSQFGPNFYIGNNPDASGTYQPLRFGRGDPRFEREDATALAEQATGRTLTPGEVSRYWTGRVLDYVRTQPGDWLQLMGRKVRLAWNASEVADTEDQLSYADWSLPLRLFGGFWHFGVLAPLALIGLWTTRSRSAELMPLYLMLAAYVASLVAFAIMARYRYPLVPFLVLFAAAGAVELARALPRRRWTPELAWAGAAAGALAVFCNWPMYSMGDMRAVTESNVGTELQAQGDIDEAVALYRDALERTPNDALVHSNLGTALAADGRLDEAVAAYERALAIEPDDADSHYNLANALLGLGRLTEAAAAFREAIRIEPGHGEAHVNLGNVLVELGSLQQAAVHYRRGADLMPDAGEALNNLGLLEAGAGDLEEAIALWRRAIEVTPDFADAHANLGSALRQVGDAEGAIRHFRRVVELTPESAGAHNDLGVMLGSTDALDEAAAHFRRAIALDPSHTEARNNLALVFRLGDDLAGAISQYRAILEIDPRVETAHNDLGILLAQENDLDAAIDHFREATRLAPGFAEAHGNLATALHVQGRLDEALNHYREAVALAPENVEMRQRLEAALAERGGGNGR